MIATASWPGALDESIKNLGLTVLKSPLHATVERELVKTILMIGLLRTTAKKRFVSPLDNECSVNQEAILRRHHSR